MPRIIFKCRYIKSAADHAENLVTYIATRDGVEKLPERMRNRPATEKQKFLVSDILDRFPDSTGLFEYEDYLANPTMENASEFISAALDQNLDQLAHQEVYVNYIATRPHAERLDAHGLFSDEDIPLSLSQTAQEVAAHTGNIWTPIISMRREDAARLGYDNAAAWIALLRQQRNIFAEQMKIASVNLRWYAAYHDEGHHPHCHMIVYSVDPREGFVTKLAIETMRSSLAREIFQQDLLQIYTEQTEQRKTLTVQSRETLGELLKQMQTGDCDNPVLENMLTQLAERLRQTTGKKQYGYLKAPVKKLVNQIVDELAKDGRVSAAYAQWQELRNEVLRTYKDDLPAPLPLSQQKEFKQIKNMVISEAVRLGNQAVVFEGVEQAEPLPEEESIIEEAGILNHIESIEEAGSVFLNLDEEGEIKALELESGTGHSSESSSTEHSNNISPVSALSTVPRKPHIAWNSRYKQARTYLYGTDITEPDFDQALPLFLLEAEDGNALAMHDLGRMFTDGLGVEMNTETAFVWYSKALAAFLAIEAQKEHRYVEYRIGKLYAAGLGTEQDYEEAANWFKEAASKNHKYAQYSLGVLYYRGRGVEHNLNTAFQLYQSSAKQGMPYADYEMAKMYRDGIGTARNTEEAELHFEAAFHGFQQMERQSRDDKLQYRLGQMIYTGTGTQKDMDEAIYYLEKSARLGNVNAQYMLGKIYLDADNGKFNEEKAFRWLTKASDNGDALAQYALGKLYRDGNYVEKNIQRAVDLFTLSAEQDNSYAAYALGKLYLQEEGISKDAVAAVRWLTLSAEQGNIYAQFFLDHLDAIHNPSMFLATTRLLHHISQIFQEEVKRLSGSPGIQTESKLRRKMREKKIAQGHAPNDHEQKLTIY